jgi:hypothetical protein
MKMSMLSRKSIIGLFLLLMISSVFNHTLRIVGTEDLSRVLVGVSGLLLAISLKFFMPSYEEMINERRERERRSAGEPAD